MLIFLLAGAILLLIFSIKRIRSIEKVKPTTGPKEMLQILRSLFWGLLVLMLFFLIPMIIWKLSGGSTNWDGVYIIFASAIGTIALFFGYYSRLKAKHLR